ncbi:MAG: hypothetical protein ACOC1E_04630 [Marinilabiliaceae bacterium]
MKLWCNKQWIGLLAGLILPVVFSVLLYNGRYQGDMDFGPFLMAMFDIQGLGKLVSVSVLPNLLVFFIAIWTNRLFAARGILFATIIYAVGTFILWFLRN